MNRIPAIKSVMTAFPYSIAVDAPIEEARQFMRKNDIRHLPVTENGELIGILSDRDIKLYLGPDFDYPKPEETKVRDVYLDHAYVVDLNERLDKVLQYMAERHIGSALITRHGKLAGVFTVSDACRSYAKFLQEKFGPPNGDEAA